MDILLSHLFLLLIINLFLTTFLSACKSFVSLDSAEPTLLHSSCDKQEEKSPGCWVPSWSLTPGSEEAAPAWTQFIFSETPTEPPWFWYQIQASLVKRGPERGLSVCFTGRPLQSWLSWAESHWVDLIKKPLILTLSESPHHY